MQEKQYYVYIATNQRNTVLYTGVTSKLGDRILQHKTKLARGFTKQYNVDKLVYYEVYSAPYEAIAREKQIKGWLRKRKIELIERQNPEWHDLAKSLELL
ncbi:MAG: Excinuclease ABC subunit C [Parcubacteria group bacterium GW2011_GWC2_45_7]|nr:MAG: Excinuclease ABC subunit C [Parcubacteria group bacterium GW2011_GWC2_45_7]KKU73654.1 MAG: Excinuclease ABC subunit C [Parcubacteria group bacterium GW2011_GWA2_47_26]